MVLLWTLHIQHTAAWVFWGRPHEPIENGEIWPSLLRKPVNWLSPKFVHLTTSLISTRTQNFIPVNLGILLRTPSCWECKLLRKHLTSTKSDPRFWSAFRDQSEWQNRWQMNWSDCTGVKVEIKRRWNYKILWAPHKISWAPYFLVDPCNRC